MPSDDRLLGGLGTALAAGNRTLADERVDALRTHILAAPGPRPRAMRRTVIALAILAALGGGVVIGHELPRPVRELAYWMRIPVESPELVDARAELDRLGRALSRRDADEVLAADRAMLALVKDLDQKEKDKVVPVAHEVHERACDFLRELGVPADTCPTGS